MIEDQPEAGHTRMGRIVQTKLTFSRIANYNNATVITVEWGNLSATRPKTEGSLSATRPQNDK